MQSSQKAAAEYIEDMAMQLATIAKAHGLLILAYVLDMASAEARNKQHTVKSRIS
jgi:uncharacterized membrane protein YadS